MTTNLLETATGTGGSGPTNIAIIPNALTCQCGENCNPNKPYELGFNYQLLLTKTMDMEGTWGIVI